MFDKQKIILSWPKNTQSCVEFLKPILKGAFKLKKRICVLIHPKKHDINGPSTMYGHHNPLSELIKFIFYSIWRFVSWILLKFLSFDCILRKWKLLKILLLQVLTYYLNFNCWCSGCFMCYLYTLMLYFLNFVLSHPFVKYILPKNVRK